MFCLCISRLFHLFIICFPFSRLSFEKRKFFEPIYFSIAHILSYISSVVYVFVCFSKRLVFRRKMKKRNEDDEFCSYVFLYHTVSVSFSVSISVHSVFLMALDFRCRLSFIFISVSCCCVPNCVFSCCFLFLLPPPLLVFPSLFIYGAIVYLQPVQLFLFAVCVCAVHSFYFVFFVYN